MLAVIVLSIMSIVSFALGAVSPPKAANSKAFVSDKATVTAPAAPVAVESAKVIKANELQSVLTVKPTGDLPEPAARNEQLILTAKVKAINFNDLAYKKLFKPEINRPPNRSNLTATDNPKHGLPLRC